MSNNIRKSLQSGWSTKNAKNTQYEKMLLGTYQNTPAQAASTTAPQGTPQQATQILPGTIQQGISPDTLSAYEKYINGGGAVEQKAITHYGLKPTTMLSGVKGENAKTVVVVNDSKTEEKQLSAQEYAKQLLNSGLETAKTNYENALLDARNSYAQRRATYGQNAEQLASMGLTGSGYAEYLDSQAYGQMREDIQKASTERAASEKTANDTYAQTLFSISQTQKANEATLDKAAEESGDAITYVKSQMASGAITQEAGEQKLLDFYKKHVDNDELTIEKINSALADLTPEHYEALKTYYQQGLTAGADVFKDGADFLSIEDAQKSIEALRSNPWVNEKYKAELENLYNQYYEPYRGSGITLHAVNGYAADENITFEMDDDRYKLKIDKEITQSEDPRIYSIGAELANGETFVLDGLLYFKGDGRMFKLKQRGNKKDHYDGILKAHKPKYRK